MVATNIPTMAKTTDNIPNTIPIIYILFFLSFGFLLRIVTASEHSANFKFPKFYFKLNLQPINKSYYSHHDCDSNADKHGARSINTPISGQSIQGFPTNAAQIVKNLQIFIFAPRSVLRVKTTI